MQAQTIYSLKYKTVITYSASKLVEEGAQSEFEIESANDYAILKTHHIAKAMAEKTVRPLFLDLAHHVQIDTCISDGEKLYRLEDIDTMLRGDRTELIEQAGENTIKGHKCHAYKIAGGATKYFKKSEMTVWVDKSAKVNPKVSDLILPYLLGYGSYGYNRCLAPGMIVRIDYKQKVYGKDVEGYTELEKLGETPVPDSEVILPWKDDKYGPAIPCRSLKVNEDRKSAVYVDVNTGSINEGANEYIERMKKLFYRVTKREVLLFKAFQGVTTIK
jgi:hypothetical protein